jgi:hypothetical protein
VLGLYSFDLQDSPAKATPLPIHVGNTCKLYFLLSAFVGWYIKFFKSYLPFHHKARYPLSRHPTIPIIPDIPLRNTLTADCQCTTQINICRPKVRLLAGWSRGRRCCDVTRRALVIGLPTFQDSPIIPCPISQTSKHIFSTLDTHDHITHYQSRSLKRNPSRHYMDIYGSYTTNYW